MTFAPSGHTHTIANITGLQTDLNAKETPAGAQSKVDLRLSAAEKASLIRRNFAVSWNDLRGGGI